MASRDRTSQQQVTEADAQQYELCATGIKPKPKPKPKSESEPMRPSHRRRGNPSPSSEDSSSSSEDYQTAREDSRHQPGSSYMSTRSQQSSVRKDRRTAVQTNINITTYYGNMHIGPSINQIVSQPSQPRLSREEKHIERCLKSSRVIQDSELETIADSIGAGWRTVGKKLKIPDDYIDYLKQDKNHSKSATYRMLYFWAQKFDKEATVRKLTKALQRAEETEAIRHLRS